MLTGGVAYRQKPSLFMTVTPGGIKESLLFGQLHSGYTFPESDPGYDVFLPDYGINVMPHSACGIPERLSRSSSLMTIYSRTALRPPSFVLTRT